MAVVTGPLGTLSHDELGVIFDGLANPINPIVAVALSSTCHGLRTPLHSALALLQESHQKAVQLLVRHELRDMRCSDLLDADEVRFGDIRGITTDEMKTLGLILRTNSFPKLNTLVLHNIRSGDTSMEYLCEGLSHFVRPSLRKLFIFTSELGPASAEAFAAALAKGSMPNLWNLGLCRNQCGDAGMKALAPALRAHPSLQALHMWGSEMGDEGVAALFDGLSQDELKSLMFVDFDRNHCTDKACATLVAAVDAGAVPSLQDVLIEENVAVSDESRKAVRTALKKPDPEEQQGGDD